MIRRHLPYQLDSSSAISSILYLNSFCLPFWVILIIGMLFSSLISTNLELCILFTTCLSLHKLNFSHSFWLLFLLASFAALIKDFATIGNPGKIILAARNAPAPSSIKTSFVFGSILTWSVIFTKRIISHFMICQEL